VYLTGDTGVEYNVNEQVYTQAKDNDSWGISGWVYLLVRWVVFPDKTGIYLAANFFEAARAGFVYGTLNYFVSATPFDYENGQKFDCIFGAHLSTTGYEKPFDGYMKEMVMGVGARTINTVCHGFGYPSPYKSICVGCPFGRFHDPNLIKYTCVKFCRAMNLITLECQGICI
jgi:hypothetical protein